ncbi:Glycine receptor subunit beta-type 4 [Orchesella cincta]|uniref:Glycine receptor subunit beta-type 4 n=1 Tax=Orchesella cincta TaxID=48709 RepID=A0A1D2N3W8_ORCCI|nr:Glycine receptor subunit beta-type 4 [Orchesella cincta]
MRSYSGIRFTILLRRKLSYHLIQTYLPSTLFIIVSWLSFLVPPESVPGRMALCMTTLLTLTAMFSAVRQNTPNVSYVKALDIWMVVCIIFVFLTLVEYTVLLKLKSKKPKPRPISEQTELAPVAQPQQPPARWTIPALQYSSDVSNFKFRGCKNVETVVNENGSTGEMRHRENGDSVGAGGDNGNNVTSPPPPPASPTPPPQPPPPAAPLHPSEKPLNKYELAAKKIEKFTSAVIPTLFVIFNFIYWPWLIESADYYHQEKSTTIFKSM